MADTEGLVLHISRSSRFGNQCQRLAVQLREINTVSEKLQKRHASLEECRFKLDTLVETVHAQNDVQVAPFYQCLLKDEYIKLQSKHSPDSMFESAVVKIQRDQLDLLTDEEKKACDNLIVDTCTESQNIGHDVDERHLSMLQIFERRKRRKIISTKVYIDLRFVLGSTAEIERLFSAAGRILTDTRISMTPMLLETLLYLKVNRKYWNFRTVIQAMSKSRKERFIEPSVVQQ